MANEYQYATLEEAFGIKTFLAPEPTVLRGDVAAISGARFAAFDENIQKSAEHAMGTPQSVQPPREPQTVGYTVAEAHAVGGAKAAWDVIPECARCDMMWFAVREMIVSDFTIMILLALCLYLFLR